VKLFSTITILFFIVFIIPVSARADEKLSWEDCINLTVMHNPELAAAHELVNKARAERKGAMTGFLPVLSGNVGYNAANSAIVSGSSVDSTSNQGIQQQLSAGPSIQANIFSGFRHAGEIEKGSADLQAAEANLQIVKNQVSFDLKTAFSKLLFNQKQLTLNRSIAERREQNLKLVELRYEVGRENKGSYLKSGASLKQAQFDVFQTQENIKVAQGELLKVLGLPEGTTIAIRGDLKNHSPEAVADFEEKALNTPAYLQAKAVSSSARSSVKIAKSDLYPSIDASGSFLRIRNDWQTDINRWNAGLNLNYPFLVGGRSYYDVRSAQAEYRRSEKLVSSTHNQIILDLKKAHSDFANASEAIHVQETLLEATQVRAEIARSQYANGLISFQDWDLIENDWINSQKTMLASVYQSVIAEAAWLQVQGKGVIP